IHLNRDGSEFISPNAEGKSPTLQSDDYIDFDKLWGELEETSEALIYAGNLDNLNGYSEDSANPDIIYIKNAGTSLELQAGQSYVIEDATKLTEINILMEGYDFFTNPYPAPTTITFTGAVINIASFEGTTVSRFPIVKINGEELDAVQGEYGEFSETGNKLIWNLPNLETNGATNRLVAYQHGSNFPGHILAPKAEFWNLDISSATWAGGNWNGTTIFRDFHGGNMEMHMWSYGGTKEASTYATVKAEKDFIGGDLSNTTFGFELSKPSTEIQTDLDLSTNYDGMTTPADTDFPLYAYTSSGGAISFSSLVFDQEGTYYFVLSEQQGTITFITEDVDGVEVTSATLDDTDTSITYDQSQYLVTVEVKDKTSGSYTSFSSNVSYQKLEYTDRQWTVLDISTSVPKFENSTENTNFFSFSKVDENGDALSGAQFGLITYETNGCVPTLETHWSTAVYYTSKAPNGNVVFTGLEPKITYFFRETSAPTGYDKVEGFWQLEKVDETWTATYYILEEKTVIDDEIEETTTSWEAVLGENDPLQDGKLVNKLSEGLSITLQKTCAVHGFGLSGAEFVVDRLIIGEDGYITVVENSTLGTFVSGSNGEFTITDVEVGNFYRLVETVAPDGYQIFESVDYWVLEVISATEFDLYVKYKESNVLVKLDGNAIANVPEFSLPTVGGAGTTFLYQVGTLLLVSGLALMYILTPKKRKKKGA
ncbi:MAG: SpaA isopeptide-forming pilin-related protein, partial [Eubacteriales bacterium]